MTMPKCIIFLLHRKSDFLSSPLPAVLGNALKRAFPLLYIILFLTTSPNVIAVDGDVDVIWSTQPAGGPKPLRESPRTQGALGAAPGASPGAGGVRNLKKQMTQTQSCRLWGSKSITPAGAGSPETRSYVTSGWPCLLKQESPGSFSPPSQAWMPSASFLLSEETKIHSLRAQKVLCRWSLKWELYTSPLGWPINIHPVTEQINECTSTIWMAKYFQLWVLQTMYNMFALEGG